MTTMMTLVNRTNRGTGKLIRRGILLSKYQYEALLHEEYFSYQWWIQDFQEAAHPSIIWQNVCQNCAKIKQIDHEGRENRLCTPLDLPLVRIQFSTTIGDTCDIYRFCKTTREFEKEYHFSSAVEIIIWSSR